MAITCAECKAIYDAVKDHRQLKTLFGLTKQTKFKKILSPGRALLLSFDLKRNNVLQVLDIHGNKYTKVMGSDGTEDTEGFTALLDAFKTNATLTSVDFRMNALDDAGKKMVTEANAKRKKPLVISERKKGDITNNHRLDDAGLGELLL